MRVLSARVVVPVAMVVLAWGGAHLLSAHSDLAVQPAAWPAPASPGATTTPSPGLPAVFSPAATASPGAAPAWPLLPGLMQRLNGDTRDTALGMYAVISQLENALTGRLQQLAQQLEPGR